MLFLVNIIAFPLQLFTRESPSLRTKFSGYFASIWNRFDTAMYVILVCAIILRYSLTGEGFAWARACYSLCLGCCYFRILQTFVVAKNIGPKLTMIRLMVSTMHDKVTVV